MYTREEKKHTKIVTQVYTNENRTKIELNKV